MKDRRVNTLLKRAAAFVLAFALTMTSSGISFAAGSIATPSNAEKATGVPEVIPSEEENTAESDKATPSDAEKEPDDQVSPGLPGGFGRPVMPVPGGQHADTEIIKETEAAEPEAATPGNAARVELTDDVSGVTVRVIDESGVLPEGTEMKVRSMSVPHTDEFKAELQSKGLMAPDAEEEEAGFEEESDDEEEYAEPEWPEMVAYDITLTDAEGNELHTLDAPVTVVYEGVDLGEDQNEAAIYHLTDDGFEYIAVSAVEDGTLSFEASEFSGYAAVGHAGAGIMTLDIGGPTEVEVGQTITLTSSVHNGSNHRWNSSTDKIATVEGKSSTSRGTTTYSGEVTGVAAGTVTITHSYTTGSGWTTSHDETYTVTVNDSASQGIIFEYHEGFSDEIDASARNIVKYTIDYIDENGNKVDAPENTTIPDKITFAGPVVTIDSNTFANIDIPGFANDGAYCYFYWQGAYTGTKYAVTSFKNTGRISDKYSWYNSYLGFTSTQGEGNDYPNDNTGKYYAYNPTGTLVVVFVKHPANAPNTYYVDCFEEDSNVKVGEHEDRSVWQNKKFTYYPYDLRSDYDAAYMNSKRSHEGYEFVGWSSEVGNDGNGIEAGIVDDSYFQTAVTENVTLYAVWKKILNKLESTKTLTNVGTGTGGAFKAGETAKFDIVVKNTGNTTQNNVVVTDTMAGAKIVEGDGYMLNADGTATIPTIEAGASVTVKAEYTVQQADIDNQTELKNTATIKGEGETTDPEPEEIPTEEKNSELTSKKTLTNGTNADGSERKFKAGEVATFDIVVENTGNTTQKNVTVSEMEGAEIVEGTGYKIVDGKAVIEEMAPGDKVTVKATYEVTQADIDSDEVLANIATVNGTPTNSVPIPKEEKNPELTSEKTLTNGTNADGSERKFKSGEVATFDIVVKNTGNTTQTNVTVSEMEGAEIVAGEGYDIVDGKAVIEKMVPGDKVTVKATYKVTQADIDSDEPLENIATVNDTPTKPEPIPKEDKDPGLSVEKSVTNKGTSEGGKFTAGDVVGFRITVKNTGNTTLTNVEVREEMAGAAISHVSESKEGYVLDTKTQSVTIPELAPGQTVKVYATYTVTQEDVDAGKKLTNTASADSDQTEPQEARADIEIGGTAALAADKRLTNIGTGKGGAFKAGETAKFDITVKNVGDTTQEDVVVTDTLAGAEIVAGDGYTVNGDGTATIGEIPAGGSVTVKAEYTVTQADIDQGTELVNTATVEGKGETPDPTPEPIPTEERNPGLTTTKTLTNKGSGTDGVFKAGETAEFDIVVKNTGNTTQSDVVVTETMAGAKIVAGDGYKVNGDGTATIGKIEVGQSVTVKAEYTVTQADIDDQTELANTATVEGEGDTPAPDPEPIPTEERNPGLEVKKSLTNPGEDVTFTAGDIVGFEITVTNTGNTTLTGVIVTEEMAGAAISYVSGSGSGYTVGADEEGLSYAKIPEIAPGQTVKVYATYTVTQEDVDAGENLTNTASADSDQTGPQEASADIEIDSTAALAADKRLTNSGTGKGGAFKAGETAEFDITVKNVGDTTQEDVVVTDTLAGARIVAGDGYTVNGDGTATIGEIPAGGSVTVKAEYTVTQADIDQGTELVNTATVEGEGEAPDPTPEPIPTEERNPGLTTTKTLTNKGSGTDGAFKAGESAEFDIVVKNTGNTTQSDVVVTETMAGAKIVAGDGYEVNGDGTATIGEIPAGKSVTVKAEYTVTQADIDDQTELANTATVEGEGDTPAPDPEPIPTEDKDPKLTAVKSVTNAPDDGFKAEQTAEFNITVTNSGNTTQTNVTVSEQLAGAKIVAGDGYEIVDGKAVIAEMEPGATVTVKAEYTVTQADIDSDAELKNIALVDGDTGTEPDPEPEIPIPEEEKKPGLAATKSVTNAPADGFKAEQTAEFDITVTNTGNTTQTNVTVSEQLTGAKIVEGEGYTINEAGQAVIAEMGPGATVTVKAEYTVTQADIDSDAELKNIALVDGDTGTEPNPEPEIPIPEEEKKPGLVATKSVTNAPAGGFKAEQTAEFDITVTNTGNTTQTNVTVSEQLAGAKIVAGDGYEIVDGKAVIAEMEPGATVTVKAEYMVTQADIDSDAELKNIALVDGDTGTEPDPEPEIPIPEEEKKPGLAATKSVTNAPADGFKAEQTAEFDITVTNTGNTTQTNVTVSEQLAGAKIVAGDGYGIVDGKAVIAEMEPGATVTVKAEYTVTQADIDSDAELKNIVLVEGDNGEDPNPTPEVKIPEEPQEKSLSAVKTVTNAPEGGFKVNETAEFNITVTNTGNTTQRNVTVTEQLAGATIVEGEGYTIVDGRAVIVELAPEATVNVKAAYTVTQADIDSDEPLKNIAVIGGGDPTDPVPNPEVVIPEIPKNGGISAIKTVTNVPEGGFKVGETAEFDISVKNTGNTTITEAIVTEQLAGAVIVEGDGYTINSNGQAVIAELAPEATVVVKAAYTLTQKDIDNVEVLKNVAVVNDNDPETPDPKPEVVIPKEPQSRGLSAVKTVTNKGTGEDGKFKANDPVNFDITVTNTGNTTQTNVVVSEQLDGAVIAAGTGYTINEAGQAVIAELAPNATVVVKATYTVTQADIDSDAELKNVALVKGDNGTNPDPEPEIPIPEEEKKPGLTSTKTLTNEGTGENGTFKAGDEATFDITVTNTGNTTQYSVEVHEQLDGANILAGKGYLVLDGHAFIAKMEPGDVVVVKAAYTVTQADIDSDAELKNIALVKGDNGTDPDPEPEIPIPEEEKKPGLTSTKTLTNEGTGENGTFKAGDEAAFDITVTNSGNTTQTNVTVTEQLAGAVIVEGEGYTVNEAGQAVIAELAPEATVVVKATYTVTQADIDSDAELKNIALVDGDNGEEPDPTPEIEIPEEEQKKSLSAVKTVTNAPEGGFKAGETAEFNIAVTNSGNTTQTNVTVTEQLAGAVITEGEGYTINEAGQAVIVELAPKATVHVKAAYTVTQADIDSDEPLKNIAVVGGGDPTEPVPDPEVVIPEIPKNGGLSAVKTVTNAPEGGFKVGETAEFDITVTNTGNTTKTDVTVAEQLAGAVIVAGEGYTVSADGEAVIAELAPEATVVVKASYTVTQEDIDNAEVLRNVVTVDDGDPETPDPEPEVVIPEEPQNRSLSAAKTLTNAGTGANGSFRAGDTAEFDITVTNTGSTTQTNVTVTEQLSGAVIVAGEGYTVNEAGQAVIAELAPGAVVTVKAIYTVTADDINDGEELKNVALVDGETGTNPDPAPETVIPEEIPQTPTPGGTTPGGTTPGGTTTVTNPETEEIPDEEVPLSSIPETEVPLAAMPEELVSILDEDVPLAFTAPQTGDDRPVGTAALFGLLALGMMGIFGILASKKDEEEA